MNILIQIIFYFFVSLFTLIFIVQTYLALPRKFKTTYAGKYTPKTLVIVPSRGTDYSMTDNLKSIKNQKNENFSIICVVDSEDDPSVKNIKEAGLDYIISNYRSGGSGKVRAIATALDRFRDFEVYVVADTDIRASPDWLVNLIRPLSLKKYGLSTTFPYFKSVGNFWSKFKTVWGFVGRGMMESKITVFGWGGSMAFRKELIEGKIGEFAQDVSDDMAITRICKERGLQIAYVPEASPEIYSPDDWGTFKEWSIRQTSLLVSRNKSAFTIGILLYGSMSLLIVASLVFGAIISPIFFLWLIPLILSEIKISKRLREHKIWYYISGIIMPFFYTWNLYRARKTESITWRGVRYKL